MIEFVQLLRSTLSSTSNRGWTVWICIAVVGYVLLCTAFRNRQKRAMEQRFNFSERSSLAKMTLEEAFVIHKWLVEQQFPFMFSAAIFFAIFKTYSIPSISRLLVATRQFGRPGDIKVSSKRIADTSILITNMTMRPPGSPQAKLAVARTNYLHNIHRRNGRISNDDMLYTLSLFALQPMQWTAKYDWRPLSDMERCAVATIVKAWGEDLQITYEALPSHSLGWTDGLHWLEELDAWSRAYEERSVEASDTNVTVANLTRELVLCQIPTGLHKIVWGMAGIMLGCRAQKAMRIPDPPFGLRSAFSVMITVRKYILRYACPPRPYFLRCVYVAESPDPTTNRYQSQLWIGRPWYVKTSVLDRWGLAAWMLWINGTSSSVVFEEGKFMPEGYLIDEIGPAARLGKGHDEMRDNLLALDLKSPSRCPFS